MSSKGAHPSILPPPPLPDSISSSSSGTAALGTWVDTPMRNASSVESHRETMRAKHGMTRLKTECENLMKESYKCLSDHKGDGQQCQAAFDAYNACRKDEHDRIIAERMRAQGY